jgi:GGDEF domain-containing protein
VLFDVSAMQAFNDDNGWDAGDKLLAGIMSVLVKCFPAASEVTRSSGDDGW